MRRYPSDVAFTPAVKQIQQAKGSRASYAKVEQGRGWKTRITSDLTEFIAGLDMFYLGASNGEGQPYVQYRGGPPGFLKVLDDQTLGFADFGGNRQYITLGNLSEISKAFIFLVLPAFAWVEKRGYKATVGRLPCGIRSCTSRCSGCRRRGRWRGWS